MAIKDFSEVFNAYRQQEDLYRNEGSKGFSNLCKIARALGYRDPLFQGSLSQGGYSGDLMIFLEDNPGAIEAIMNWIVEQGEYASEWKEELESELDEDEEEDEEGEE